VLPIAPNGLAVVEGCVVDAAPNKGLACVLLLAPLKQAVISTVSQNASY